jgi:alkylated DNA repair dioxygenase AlkB
MGTSIQDTLFDEFDDVSVSVDPTAFDRATHHRLDEGSWVTHVPRFVGGHHRLFAELAEIPLWEQRQRWMYDRVVDEPRLTAEYTDLDVAPSSIALLAETLSRQLGVDYQRVWMNWYRDQTDGTGWHADRPANKPETAIVPVVSLGAPRRFLIRPAGGGPSTVFTPAGGDLLIMQGRCQRDWQHCVPKQKSPAGPRMSLNFSSSSQS